MATVKPQLNEPNATSTRDRMNAILRIISREVPLINLVYDLIFDEMKSDGLKDMLNLIGLVDALMLGFSLSVLTSVGFDELIAQDNRYFDESTDPSLNGYYELYHNGDRFSWASDKHGSPSSIYAFYTYTSIALLFASLMVTVLIYLDFSSKKFSGKTQQECDRLLALWWDYAKYCVLLCFISTVTGVWFAISTVESIMIIKFPDYYVERTGKLGSMDQNNSSYGACYGISVTIYIVFFVFCICGLGLGTRAKFIEEDQIELRERTRNIKFYGEEQNNWKSVFESCTEDELPQWEIDDLVETLIKEGVVFKYRMHVTDEQLTAIGIFRTGHRIIILLKIAGSINTLGV